jgi:hypothetical protein
LFGRANIESPLALFQEQIEVFSGNAVELTQMSFGLIPKVFNSVNMVMVFCKQLAVINSVMKNILITDSLFSEK